MLLAIKFILEDNNLILILDTLTFYIYKMNFINNLIHNDFVWIPLYIGMIGFLGHAWFIESTKVFTSLNQINSVTTGSPGLETISESTVTPQTFNFTQQQLMGIQNYRDQEVQTLSDITSRIVTSGPRTTLQEVVVDQNIRRTHWVKSYNLREIRDSQVSLMDKMVQTDSQGSLMDKMVQTDLSGSQPLADFVGIWSSFQ